LLPAGPLREPPESLRRADVIALTRSVANDPQDELRRRVRRFNASAPIVRTGHRSIGFFDARGNAADSPFRAVGFCGIGNPEQFRRDLVAAGVDLLSWIPFRDHHRYTAREVAELQRKAAARDCALVTTEKDLVRIAPFLQPGEDSSLLTLRIEAEVHDADLLTDLVARLLHRDRT
jgi:tetraacyldisaccharide 4'-kinase